MKTLLTVAISAALAATGTWLYLQSTHPTNPTPDSDGRKVLFYQSAMHPWIKSDKPGRCTICGMELTPVYEGEKGLDESGDSHIVSLTQSQIQVLHVQTTKVAKRPLTRTLRVAGNIDDNATRRRMLAAYVDGRIDKLHVNFVGAEVTEGQPLADLYSPSLLQAEREYRQLNGDLKTQAALRLRQMGLTPQQIEAVELKPADQIRSEILAPLTGTVISQAVIEGQYVTTGQPLFEIADFSTMWFVFRAYEPDIPWIKPGQKVHISTPSIPNKDFMGMIQFMDPNIDESTRSTAVRVELANPLVNGRRELLHRLYADGVVELDAPEVLSAPRQAVIQTGPQAFAYVDLGGGAYEQRTLKTGLRGDTHIEILSGLAEGENVVTNGNLLIDGQAEMNRAFMSPPDEPSPAAPQPSLTEDQRNTLIQWLTTADAMAAALANDDLTQFNQASAPAMDTTGALITALRPLVDDLDALEKTRHFHGFNDIHSARVAFHKFSVAAVAALEPLRKAGQTPEFQVYECGMVDEAIPKVPPKARWIQTGGRSLANPFFGAEMLKCGKTIQP